jgi:hypothetical protein
MTQRVYRAGVVVSLEDVPVFHKLLFLLVKLVTKTSQVKTELCGLMIVIYFFTIGSRNDDVNLFSL